MSPIIGMQRRLAESGRIRIGQQVATGGTRKDGRKSTRPARLETFRLTSSNEKAINAVASRYGGKVVPWADAPAGKQWELFTESSTLSVLIPPEAMSFSQNYEAWSGGGCKRRCDGAYDVLNQTRCECAEELESGDADERLCKPHTRLSVMLDGLPGAGLWRLDTQGWNAANEMGGAFELATLIARATGKSIIPGVLRLEQREVKRPDQPTRQFAVPVLDFDLDLSAIARAETPALGYVTPVPAIEPTRTLADELAHVGEDKEPSTRSNAAEPVHSTGLKPRPRGAVAEDDGDQGVTGVVMVNEAQVTQLHNAFAILEEQDKATVKGLWEESKIPTGVKFGGLTSAQAEAGLQLIHEVLNTVDTSDDETGGEPEDDGSTPDTPVVTKGARIPVPAITKAQVAKVNIMYANLYGEGDRVAMHTWVSGIIKRNITSINDLTKGEATRIIDQLKANEEDPF